jgi:Na+-transporting methylmalonyl-CoA/oxaloacetate decarboxylase gamma subunit
MNLKNSKEKLLSKNFLLIFVFLVLIMLLYVLIGIGFRENPFKYNKLREISINYSKKYQTCKDYYQQMEPRILCTIFTVREAHKTKMKAIHETWSKRF